MRGSVKGKGEIIRYRVKVKKGENETEEEKRAKAIVLRSESLRREG